MARARANWEPKTRPPAFTARVAVAPTGETRPTNDGWPCPVAAAAAAAAALSSKAGEGSRILPFAPPCGECFPATGQPFHLGHVQKK